MKDEKYFDLQMFSNPIHDVTPNVNVTTANDTVSSPPNDLSPTMKTFYDTSLLENSRSENYFNQFGKKQALPKNHGNTVEWRKFDTYAPKTTPLTEGVTPDGNKVNMRAINKQISQYGDYTTISDRLELEAVDPIIMSVTEEHGAQAGETLDLITRNELMTGTNVLYPGNVASRANLASTDKISATLINMAATILKNQRAPQVEGGGYIAFIHPSVAFDLRESNGWLDAHKYAQPEEIYNGEIGKLHNVRFIESPSVPCFQVSSIKVYATFVIAKDAYGIIDPSAESLEVIVKQRGSAGTNDPLDQRSTVGWKASHAAKILYDERIVRIETSSSLQATDTPNYIVPASAGSSGSESGSSGT